jgi:hypothetical protein
LAKEVGLDVTGFETCFDSGKYQAAVKKDIDDGNRLGGLWHSSSTAGWFRRANF